jgi:hypothetical protein
MLIKLFVLPLFLHVLMTVWIGLRSFRARSKAVRYGQAKLDLVEADASAWPRRVRLIGNNFDSQFDAPMLWYGASAIVLALSLVDWAFVALSFLFLLARLGHSFIHIGGGNVPERARVFILGFFVIVAIWVWLAVKVFVTPMA